MALFLPGGIKTRGVLLDLDGTILDSQEGILATFRHTLAEMGCGIPDSHELFGWIGPPFPESLRNWTDLDDSGIARAVATYRDYYTKVGESMSAPFPGMVDAIHTMRRSGLTLGLATSKPRSQALRMLDQIGLLHVFTAKGCASDDEERGTKSEVVDDALSELAEQEIPTSGLVMVGDRIHDFEAATEHDLTSIAVTWGYGNASEWAHATSMVSTPEELLSVVLGDEAVFELTP